MVQRFCFISLMEKRCTWDNGLLWLKDRPCKIYVGQWLIFHVSLILPYIIVRLKLFSYFKKWHRPGLFVPLRALALVILQQVSYRLITDHTGVQNVCLHLGLRWVETLYPGARVPITRRYLLPKYFGHMSTVKKYMFEWKRNKWQSVYPSLILWQCVHGKGEKYRCICFMVW